MDEKKRLTTRDFDPDVLQLFDQYVHGVIDRRSFLSGASRVAGAAGATALLAALAPRFAAAQQVKPDDARLDARHVTFASPAGSGKAGGYLVRPKRAKGKLATVLVAHENRGLNPHVEDVARRLALEGYIAFAPDALFPLGGYPGDEDKARALFGTLDQAKVREDFIAAADYLAHVKGSNDRMGATGFCWGGGIVNVLATRLPALDAAVPFYGIAPPVEAVPSIRAELLVVLAGEDARVNASWPEYEKALGSARVTYTLLQPPGTQHGFNNDTTPRYDEAAARQAWAAMLALFERKLKRVG